MTWFERLSGLDSAFLYLEDATAHMHVGAVGVFAGQPPSRSDVLSVLSSRIARAPRYRQKVAFVRYDLGRPAWVDDADFDFDWHVRAITLPPPGDDEALHRLAGRLFSQRLDRSRPLWELWLIDGLRDGRFALLWKLHHCMVDGIAGVDLASVLLDPTPEPPALTTPAPWTPRPAPDDTTLLANAIEKLATDPIAAALGLAARTEEARERRLGLLGSLKPFLKLTELRLAPDATLNRDIGPHRRFQMVSLDLKSVRQVAAAFGVKVNDVAMAAVAGALREVFEARGEPVPAELRVMVPVNIRTPPSRTTPGNQVSTLFCPLPLGEADAVSRLRRIATATRALKEGRQAAGTHALTQLSNFVPPPLAAFVTRHLVLRWFNVVVTNVPGPPMPLYLRGRKLVSWYPMVPLAPGQTLGIALLSYAGALGFGVLAESGAERDAAVLTRALPRALEELGAVAAPAAADAAGA